MNPRNELPRIVTVDADTNPLHGSVHWAPIKSLWLFGHCIVAIVGGVLTFSLDALAVFLVTTAVTICLGHSLGMHRKLIHNSYACSIWLERFFVHLGVLVGMAGPIGMVRTHDLRDWAQRQSDCHPYLRHRQGMPQDAWWQMHCDLRLSNPPNFELESRIGEDRIFKFMEKTWMLQQLPLALLLLALGGIPWLVWGMSVRIVVSVTGHWFVGYFAHNSGEIDNEVVGAAVQGHNVKFASFLTMGESWHNNHHAYPGSAALGLFEDQPDPGWWVLNALHNVGLVSHLVLPEDLPVRTNLSPVSVRAGLGFGMRRIKPCRVLGMLH